MTVNICPLCFDRNNIDKCLKCCFFEQNPFTETIRQYLEKKEKECYNMDNENST